MLGVWAYPSDFRSEKAVDLAVDRLSGAGFTAIFANVKDSGGNVYFGSSVGSVSEQVKEFDFLRHLCDKAHEKGMELHAWFVVFCEGLNRLGGLLARHPEYAMVSSSGERIGWMCPSHEEVHEYLLSLFREVLEGYDVDGVHLDYIRFPDSSACFCPNCGGGGAREEGWVLRGIQHVTSFVEKSHRLAREYGVIHSAAVFPDYPICATYVRQDWLEWVEKGLLDYVVPMNYTNITRVFERLTQVHAALVGGSAVLLEGVGKRSSASSLSPGKMLDQVLKALSNGADGAVIFPLSGMEERDFKVLSRVVV